MKNLLLGAVGVLITILNILGGLALFLSSFVWGVILSVIVVTSIRKIPPFQYGMFLRYLTAVFAASSISLLISHLLYKWLPESRKWKEIELKGRNNYLKMTLISVGAGSALGFIIAGWNLIGQMSVPVPAMILLLVYATLVGLLVAKVFSVVKRHEYGQAFPIMILIGVMTYILLNSDTKYFPCLLGQGSC